MCILSFNVYELYVIGMCILYINEYELYLIVMYILYFHGYELYFIGMCILYFNGYGLPVPVGRCLLGQTLGGKCRGQRKQTPANNDQFNSQ